MENEILYLPVIIFGEHVVIDYHKRELIFPNRDKEDNKIDFELSLRISIYLNEEGFLNFETGAEELVLKAGDLPVNLDPALSDPVDAVVGEKEIAEVRYTKGIAKSCALVGFDWGPGSAPGRRICDFAMDSLGELEASGTEMEKGVKGWAVYEGETFMGKLGDSIELKGIVTGT
jgi:hypothetical protein